METRSQRRQAQQQRPAYPQIAAQSAPITPAGSAFQSSSSLASVNSMNLNSQQQAGLQVQQPGFASAPLPSPSAQQPAGYFGAFSQAAPTSHPSQQARIPQSNQMQAGFSGQRGGSTGGSSETAPFLQDFSLVAEAAKRAQMACLARDLGDVGL